MERIDDQDARRRCSVDGFGSWHDELALLVEAGLTPMEAIQAATINAARFMEKTDSLGSIETGKTADLVLLDRNPLDDIRNTTAIRGLVFDGRWFDRGALDKMLGEAERTAATAQSGRGRGRR